MALTAWDEQSFQLAQNALLAQNGARNGRSRHRVTSRGAGQTHIIQPLRFAVTFCEEPTFTSGVALASGQLQDGAYPVCSVGVFKWLTDNRGFYLGAYLWLAVTSASVAVSEDNLNLAGAIDAATRAKALNGLELTHHLCFEALAMRDVNIDQLNAD